MNRKKNNLKNLIIAGVLLVLFVLLLGFLYLWELTEPNMAPALAGPAPTVQTIAPELTVPVVSTQPTTAPTEETVPEFEARRLNFLLVGRDAHAEGENGRSDSMILCSVDTGAKTVTMISFLRDIYLPIPGHGSSRLNAAYSWGGAELLVQTLAENFGVTVDVTLEIDFAGFESLIDLLNGVDIALTAADEILDLPGIDEVLVGLNDLSLGYGRRFMFELLADGTVEMICRKCADRGIPYGFGGIASLGKGMLPAEYIIQEHYRLGSGCAILSRSFCDVNRMQDLDEIRERFRSGVRAIREYEEFCRENPQNYEQNRLDLIRIVDEIVGRMKV